MHQSVCPLSRTDMGWLDVRHWAFPVRPLSGYKAAGPFVDTVVAIIVSERRDLVVS